MREGEAPRNATSAVGSRHAAWRRAAFVATVCLMSCSDPRLPGPSEPASQPTPTTPVAPAYPALTRPGEIYVGPADLYASIRSLASRYVLYEDGTFGLQFIQVGEFFEYRGRYARADSLITFDWDGWSTAGPWGATGTFRGDSLVVKYNPVMQMTDFIDGTYVRPPGTQ